MRRLLAWSLLAVLLMGAVTHPDPLRPIVVERMTFRDGQYPDVAYTGCDVVGIMELDPTTTHATNDTASIGDIAGDGSDQQRALIRFDISALPDTAVVTRAVLRLALTGYAVSTTYEIACYRVMRRWDNDATWNQRIEDPDGGGAATDSLWRVAGLGDVAGALTYRGASVVGMTSRRGLVPVTGSTAPTGREGGLYTAIGTDSVYSGAYSTGAQSLDCDSQPAVMGRVATQTSLFASEMIFEVDVTDVVDKWHTKQWANHGLVLAYLLDDLGSGYTQRLQMRTDDHATTATRPSLVVDYVFAVEDTNSTIVMRENQARDGIQTIGWGR